MKTKTRLAEQLNGVAAIAAAILISTASTAVRADDNWKDKAISPVANPLFFESPLIESEIRPMFVYHKISDDFVGGFARVYAVQARWAVNDRLAIIATKDGFIQLRANGLRKDGWADIGAGLKYALIDDKENNFILTPGLKFELPTGNRRVFQGNGDGEFDVFVSAMKGWENFHATASFGGRIPVNFSEETASLHYSLQLDYHVCRWFIPFVTVNGFTVVSETDNGPALNVEGYDLINFGSSRAGGFMEVTVGGGFRSKLCKNADIGFAYEKAVTSPKGLFDDRYTVDMILHF